MTIKSRAVLQLIIGAVLGGLLLASCTVNEKKKIDDSNDSQLAILLAKQGIGYMEQGQYDTADKRFQRALNLSPNSSEIHNFAALFNQRIGRNDKADFHFRRSIELNPSYSSAHLNYGGFLCANGKVDQAVEQFMKAIDNPIYERKEAAFYNAGLCLFNNQQLVKSEQYLRESLALRPAYPPALLKMADLTHSQKRFLQSRAYLQRFHEVNQQTAQSLWLAYQVETELGDKNAAASYALLLKGRFPKAKQTALLIKRTE